MGVPVHIWEITAPDDDGLQDWFCPACDLRYRGRADGVPKSTDMPCVEKHGPADRRRWPAPPATPSGGNDG